MYLKGSLKLTSLMQQYCITYCIGRYLHTTASLDAKMMNMANREGKFMRKIMHSEVSIKKKWFPERLPKVSVPSAEDRIVNPHVTRRVIQLNRIFMKHITDVMSTGEVSSQLLGRNIEISNVQMANHFRDLSVMWFTSDTKNLKETEKILNDVAFKIRHELTQLRVIGIVPKIHFVMDKKMMYKMELDRRFDVADYGEDYVRTVNITPSKPQLTLFTKLPEETRKKIQESKPIIDEIEVQATEYSDKASACSDDDKNNNNNNNNDDDIYNVVLPPMRHDVLGFDQALLMSKIKQALRVSQEGSRLRLTYNCAIPDITEFEYNPNSISTIRTDDEEKAFAQFIRKREINERRNRQQMSDSVDPFEHDEDLPERNMYEEEDYDNFDDISPRELE